MALQDQQTLNLCAAYVSNNSGLEQDWQVIFKTTNQETERML